MSLFRYPCLAAVVVLSLVLGACGSPEREVAAATATEEVGRVGLVVTTGSLTGVELARVTLTLSGTSMKGSPVHIETELAHADGQWTGRLVNVPLADSAGYTVEGAAYDAEGRKVYAGRMSGVQVVANQDVSVFLTLQYTGEEPGQTYENAAPVILGWTTGATDVGFGVAVRLEVAAMDPDSSAPLTYEWTEEPEYAEGAGRFQPASGSSRTTWTCVESEDCREGEHVLVARVTDDKGTTSAASVRVRVARENGAGNVVVEASLNHWPEVQEIRLYGDGQLVPLDDKVTLEAVASDPDGDGLTYGWRARCSRADGSPVEEHGSFESTGSDGDSSPFRTYFPPATSVPLRCRLEVTVRDVRPGFLDFVPGLTRSAIIVNVAPLGVGPQVDYGFQSRVAAAPGDTVKLQVFFTELGGLPVTAVWSAEGGELVAGSQQELRDAGGKVIGSEVQWRAGCGPTAHVFARLSSSPSKSTTLQTFDIVQACSGPQDALSYFETVPHTDTVAEAVVLGGARSGTLDLSQVRGRVRKAYLYWHASMTSADPAAAALMSLGGTEVTGTAIGYARLTGQRGPTSQAYRADVTELVHWEPEAPLDTLALTSRAATRSVAVHGATLVVFFDDGIPDNNRDVLLYHGNESTEANQAGAEGWSVALDNIPAGPESARLYLQVAGGDGAYDAPFSVNGEPIDPGFADAWFNGWDAFVHDVTPALAGAPGELKTLTVASTPTADQDHVSLVLAVVSLPAGAAGLPPPPPPEPDTDEEPHVDEAVGDATP